MANAVWLKDVYSEDIGIIGLKASRMSNLYQNGFAIPYSFILTIQANQYFLENRGLMSRIKKVLAETDLNHNSVISASVSIQEMIQNSEIPDTIKEDMIYCYGHMNVDTDVLKMLNSKTLNFIKAGRDYPYLALRPSFNVPGLKAKYILNIKGKENLVYAIKNIYASMFSPENIPIIKETNLENLGLAILIQKMVNSDKYATINISNQRLSINCVYGLGESFSIGNPDSYIVDANSLELISKINNKQDVMFIRDDNYGRTIRKNISQELANKEKLSYEELRKVSNFSINVFNHLNKDIRVELALENGKFYLIDVSDYVQESIVNDNINSMIQDNSQNMNQSPIVDQDMFSMFGNQDSAINQQPQSYVVNNAQENVAKTQTSQNQISKVPISFDIKITDATNVDELKSKLKAIKEFINQEF